MFHWWLRINDSKNAFESAEALAEAKIKSYFLETAYLKGITESKCVSFILKHEVGSYNINRISYFCT